MILCAEILIQCFQMPRHVKLRQITTKLQRDLEIKMIQMTPSEFRDHLYDLIAQDTIVNEPCVSSWLRSYQRDISMEEVRNFLQPLVKERTLIRLLPENMPLNAATPDQVYYTFNPSR